jgi:hypothetical protein
MFKRSLKKLTDVAKRFLVPSNPTHRQYEALRAFFVDHTPSADAAKRFGYTANSFRVLCHHFRRNPDRQFFLAPSKGPKVAPKKDRSREEVVMLRKQNYSIYDISHALEEKSVQLSPGAVSLILKEEGFARLPRRAEEERLASSRPAVAEKADVRQVSLQPRTFRTRFGGLFLFLPFLAKIPFDAILQKAGFPGTKMIPAANAMRSLLALKLFGSARHSHVMSDVFDEGLALFAGLNLIPKRAFLTEYSCRIDPSCYPEVMRQWFDAMSTLGLERGLSFDIDFHTIPYHGDDALVEKHYVSKRSRRQKGILAFVAQDATTRVFCYANGTVTKEQQNDEILRFVEFWKQRTGHLPEELVFDSKLTTYENLSKLNKMGINFMTLRRRTNAMLRDVYSLEPSAWRQIELENVARVFKTPKIIDEHIRLTGYDRPIRQIVITELGHEEPTFLLTNQMSRSPAKLIGRYAQRMIIENNISDGIDFFHMDALSSAVAMKINCDLQLTLMASSLYRLLGSKIGNPYQKAKSRHIFRDFINATATISIGEHDILVRFQKRAHNPFLLAAGFDNLHVPIPWLHNRRLAFLFG